MHFAEEPARAPSNRILAALPSEEYERLLPHQEYVALPQRHVLFEPDEPIPYAYFPFSGAVSLLAELEDGSEVEVGTIGREGMCGLALVLGTDSVPFRAVGEIAGAGVRVGADQFRGELSRCAVLHRLLLSYAQARLVQTAVTAACNQFHTVDRRLARWLLVSRDRVQSDELELTEDFLAAMLGVRRAGVSQATGRLREAGLIEHGRGRYRVLDPARLERAACECYRITKKEFDRLLIWDGPAG